MVENGSSKGASDQNVYNASENLEVESCHSWKAINKLLIRVFERFGEIVGTHPIYFIIFPIIITAGLAFGALRINILDDPFTLFVPKSSYFQKEFDIIKHHFPTNYTHGYSVTRFIDYESQVRVIVKPKNGSSILLRYLWDDILRLHKGIINTNASYNGENFRYNDICARFNGRCAYNTALNIYQLLTDFEDGHHPLSYPVTFFPLVFPQILGSPKINYTSEVITDAEAILLTYFTILAPEDYLEKSYIWQQAILDYLLDFESDTIDISYYVGRSLNDELVKKMNSALPYAPLTGFIMIVNCIVLLWMSDCVRSKPYIGVVGITSAAMAAVAAFGLLMLCGVTYTRLNVVALFLVLGIGVDDIFVAIAAWQKTSDKDTVPKRLARTYADAAISVTITSLTNFLSFLVGTTTPIYIVQSFCLYCSMTILFAYFWFLTFCGGFLALSGYMEEKRMHALFFYQVKPNSVPKEKRGCITKYLLSSDLVDNDIDPNIKVKPHVLAVFFRDKVGGLLCKTYFRVFVAITVVGYLIGAIYGAVVLKTGLDRDRMARDDSYVKVFNKDENDHFRSLAYTIQVIISGNVTYSDPETQKQMLDLLKAFESTKYGSDSMLTQAWIRRYVNIYKRNEALRKRITDEAALVEYLRTDFFTSVRDPRRLDLDFNDDFTRIEASRFVIQAANVTDVYDDTRMMNEFRRIAEESPLNVTVFHIFFGLFDQNNLLRPITSQSIASATVIVVLVSLLFIPTVNGAIAIAISIGTIAVGVMGYMGFWGVNLDQVSVGSIFMCIGFSVDFSAHITYSYYSQDEKSSEERIRNSLFHLGVPILQGGWTTVQSLITFLLIPGYGYRTFFKTITLVTIFATYYSLIVIPLMLTALDAIKEKYFTPKRTNEVVKGINYVKTPENVFDLETVNIKMDDPNNSNGHAINGNGVSNNGHTNGHVNTAFTAD